MKQYEVFKFKQFEIQHNHSAMKVGTDGVLLGAWAGTGNPNNVLDIGTGTGLVALMLSQRFPNAQIHGIEINEQAIIDARQNFRNSPFSTRLELIHQKVQDFQPSFSYDLVVSNPPFFQNALESESENRTTARHNKTLSLQDLISAVDRMLSSTGEFALILPSSISNELVFFAKNVGLYLNTEVKIKGNPNVEAKRVLLSLSRIEKPIIRDEIVIEKQRHDYTDAYVSLTENFYLKM